MSTESESSLRVLLRLTTVSSWTLGDNWPLEGEVDIYEGWNTVTSNTPAVHMGDSSTYGSCTLDGAGQSASVVTSNCDNGYSNPPFQYSNQGCTVADKNGPWASSVGGTCESISGNVAYAFCTNPFS